jgi:hypothetical protein
MDVCQDPVVVTQNGDTVVLRRASIDRTELTDSVPVANLQPGYLTGIFLILRIFANGRKLIETVVFAYAGRPPHNDMAVNPGASTDFHVFPDNRVRTNLDIVRNPG